MIGDAWRLAVGTFTAIPTRGPETVDKKRAGLAVLLSPLAFLPVAAGVAVVLRLGQLIEVPPLALAVVGVGLFVLGNRAFHLDGLADTADSLASSYDSARALEVARLGNVGPAGVGAVVLVLLLQVAGASALLCYEIGPLVVAVLACIARLASSIGLLAPIRAARAEGMGATFAGSVQIPAAIAAWLIALGSGAVISALLDQPLWQGAAAVFVAGGVVALLVRRAVTRLGGMVGDVIGASVEIAFGVLLLVFVVG